MLGAVDPALLDRVRFPLGEQTKHETRAEAAARGTRGRAAGREPGGVLPRRRRLPRVPRAPGACELRGRDRRHGGRDARVARRLLEVHARAATRPRSERRTSAVRACGRTRRRTRSRSGARDRLAVTTVAGAWPSLCPGRECGREGSLPLGAGGQCGHADRRGLRARARRARARRRSRPVRGPVRRRCGRRCGGHRARCLNRATTIPR